MVRARNVKFASRFITRGTNDRNAKFEQKGPGRSHVTYFRNFGTPSKVQNRYIWLSRFGLTPRRRGSPGTISVKFLWIGHRWPRCEMA